MVKLLVIEAFYGGSHRQLLDTILASLNSNAYDLFTLSAKKWHWRTRTSALHFSLKIPFEHEYEILFTSSVLNLAELIGMRPDLANCRKIVYFHENQLVYPVQEIKERDCQFGLNQISTCLAADVIIFNSSFNKSSFLSNIKSFLNIKSESDPLMRNIADKIEPKCEVIYFPINFNNMPRRLEPTDSQELHLVWPHRWEHDKNPETLVEVVTELHRRQVSFKLSILGERFQEIPECLTDIQQKLGDKLVNCGYLSREKYLECLLQGDIVISTASHEFYGVSMIEAVYCGCLPVAPNKLVYPEIYPSENLFNTTNQLIKMLYNWCRNLPLFHKHRTIFFNTFSFDKFSSEHLLPKYVNILQK